MVRLDEARVGRLAARLDRVARVGQDDDLVAADEELPGVPGDLLLAVGEGEPGEVAHVLAADPEVGVDPGGREAGAEAGEPGRSGRPVGLLPVAALRRRSVAAGEVRRRAGQARHWM